MHLNVYGCNFAAHVCFTAEVYFRVSVLPLCWTCGLDHSMLKYFLWNNFYEIIRNIYWVTDWDPKTLVSRNTTIIICSNIWPLALDLDTEPLNPLKCPVWQGCLLFQWGDCWWASGWRLVSERPTGCLVTKSCPTLCDPMGCSTPVFPLFHYLPEPAQTHVHWVSDATQSSHPLSSPSLLALNLSQHQGLFQWVSSLHQEAKVLEPQLQHQSFQGIFKVDFLHDWVAWSPCCPRDSWESSPTPQFESINSWVLSFLYGPTLTSIHDYWRNHSFDYMDLCCKVMSLLFNMLTRFS